MTSAAVNSPVNVPAWFEISWEIQNTRVKKGTGEEKTQPGRHRSELLLISLPLHHLFLQVCGRYYCCPKLTDQYIWREINKWSFKVCPCYSMTPMTATRSLNNTRSNFSGTFPPCIYKSSCNGSLLVAKLILKNSPEVDLTKYCRMKSLAPKWEAIFRNVGLLHIFLKRYNGTRFEIKLHRIRRVGQIKWNLMVASKRKFSSTFLPSLLVRCRIRSTLCTNQPKFQIFWSSTRSRDHCGATPLLQKEVLMRLIRWVRLSSLLLRTSWYPGCTRSRR